MPGAWRGEDGPRLPAPGLVTDGTGILGLCGRTLSVRAMILRTAPGDSVPVRGKKANHTGLVTCHAQKKETYETVQDKMDRKQPQKQKHGYMLDNSC